MLVGGVEQDGLARLLAAQDEHVVVHGSDDQLVDLGLVVVDVERALGHWPILPAIAALTKRSSTVCWSESAGSDRLSAATVRVAGGSPP